MNEWQERAERAEATELRLTRRIQDILAQTKETTAERDSEIFALTAELGRLRHRLMVREYEITARNAANATLGEQLAYAQAEFRRVSSETDRAVHGDSFADVESTEVNSRTANQEATAET